MPYTVTECADFVRLTLGGPAAAALPTLTLVNMAGHHFVGLSKWKFMERRASYLGTTANQSYVAAPSDFGEPVSLGAVTINAYYQPSSIGEINELRASSTAGVGEPYLYCVTHTTPSGSTAAVPYIELYPTPSATVAQAILLIYRARWAELTSDSDYIPFPDYTKALFLRLVQSFARGFMEEDKGSLSLRLADAHAWPEFVNAAKQDRRFNSDHGELRGDIADKYPGWTPRLFDTITGP